MKNPGVAYVSLKPFILPIFVKDLDSLHENSRTR